MFKITKNEKKNIKGLNKNLIFGVFFFLIITLFIQGLSWIFFLIIENKGVN